MPLRKACYNIYKSTQAFYKIIITLVFWHSVLLRLWTKMFFLKSFQIIFCPEAEFKEFEQRGLNLSRGSKMVGSTQNCINCFKN